jgi:hypothetical protein
LTPTTFASDPGTSVLRRTRGQTSSAVTSTATTGS